MGVEPCRKFFAKLDANKYPIPGTEMSFFGFNEPCDNICSWTELTPKQMTVPVGVKRCLHPDGIRYFYQVYRKSGQVKPNSLVQGLQFPETTNSCLIREWYRLC